MTHKAKWSIMFNTLDNTQSVDVFWKNDDFPQIRNFIIYNLHYLLINVAHLQSTP